MGKGVSIGIFCRGSGSFGNNLFPSLLHFLTSLPLGLSKIPYIPLSFPSLSLLSLSITWNRMPVERRRDEREGEGNGI